MEQVPSIETPLAAAHETSACGAGIGAGEEALIARAQANQAHFADLYRHHYPAIGAYLYRRCGDTHATEDMLSETFLAALRALPRFRVGSVPFRHWLYRIATNVANQRARKLRARLEELELPHGLVDTRSQPFAPVIDLGLVRALLALSPVHQAVLTLHYVEGLGVDEVAAVLRCRPGTVKSRLSRAREALGARLGG